MTNTTHNVEFYHTVEKRLYESAKHAEENLKVSYLKSEGQSCATCSHCNRYKYTYRCNKKDKVISLYYICAMHCASK